MKLLCIFDGRRALPHLQIDYIYGLEKWFSVFIYGPNEFDLNSRHVSPIQFSYKLNLTDICGELNPDMIILPEFSSINKLLPYLGDFKKINNTPIVSIEDVYYSENRKWHVENGIDYVISRVPVDDKFFSVPYVWLPWAADDGFSVNSKEWEHRYNKVLFVGEGFHSQNKFYATRKKAIYILGTNGLLDSFRSNFLEFYKEKMDSYRFFLSDAWHILKMAPPKTFEAMASGCTVLSPDFIGKKELFGGEECFVSYDMECEDLLNKTYYCIVNSDYSKYIASNGMNTVIKKHMFSNRIEELRDIIEDILNKGEIRRKWSI